LNLLRITQNECPMRELFSPLMVFRTGKRVTCFPHPISESFQHFLKVSFLAMVLILFPFWGKIAWGIDHDLKIETSVQFFVFPYPGKGDQDEFVSSVQVKPDLALFFSESLQLTVAPRFRVGITDPEYHLFSPDDIYLEYVRESYEFRFGYQTFFWGTVESANIVDILNQEDYIGDFFDPDKLGEPSLRARFLIGENRFDFFQFFYFTPAPIPGKVNRFNFFDGTRNISGDAIYTHSAKRFRQQFALRWERTFGSADVGLSYFNGYEKFPIIFLAPGEENAQVFYYEMQQAGVDLQMSLGNWLIKGETLFQETGAAGILDRSRLLPNGAVVTQNLVPEDHAALVGGVEYTFFGVLGNSDLGMLGEYLYDSEQSLDAVAFRPFQNDLFMGFRWSRNNSGDGEILWGVTLDLKEQSQIWRVEYSERFFERIKLMVRADIIDADPKDPISGFNNDDRFSWELLYVF